jgi:hypothetical protein
MSEIFSNLGKAILSFNDIVSFYEKHKINYFRADLCYQKKYERIIKKVFYRDEVPLKETTIKELTFEVIFMPESPEITKILFKLGNQNLECATFDIFDARKLWGYLVEKGFNYGSVTS